MLFLEGLDVVVGRRGSRRKASGRRRPATPPSEVTGEAEGFQAGGNAVVRT